MTKDVVIIGGGVIGASVAYHLSLQGCRKVLVLDRAPQHGMGSTGKATGGFHCQFSTPINVRLSLLSRQKLLPLPFDITPLHPTRFAEGALNPETGVL